MKKQKKVVSYSLTEDLITEFQLVCHTKNEKMSDVVDSLIRDYVIKNKANLNEYMLNFYKNNIN